MKTQRNRRQFLRTASLAGIGCWVGGRPAVAQSESPNEKLNIACIGIGNRGAANVRAVSGENIVALCDVERTADGITGRVAISARKQTLPLHQCETGVSSFARPLAVPGCR
jgi:hypothetical protein